jgi:hypothetical protein
MASPHQDLPAILQILFAALAEYGCPQAIVSDNGSVFRAGDYLAILRALDIEPLHIAQGKPWQNMIEAQCKVQLRLADFHFEQAQTLEDVQNQHAAFIETFHTTSHWAHRTRADGHRTPVEVLGGSGGGSSNLSVCVNSLDGLNFCVPSITMALSVCSASISMRKMASPGSASPSGFMKAS